MSASRGWSRLAGDWRAVVCYWVVIPALVVGAGRLADRLGGLPGMGGAGARIAAGGLALAGGVTLVLRAMRDLLVRGRGLWDARHPPRELVTGGAYARCRHPMFLGYDLAALGTLLMLGSWGALTVAWPLLLAAQWLFLTRVEEPRLERRFGAAHRAYAKRVPLLLPRLRRVAGEP